MTRIYDDKMLIKVCELCKKKINIHSVKCFDCNSNAVAIHYNVCIEMHDYSGGINVIGFDPIVEKFFGKCRLTQAILLVSSRRYTMTSSS